jgi:2-keto-3-deoxy-L-rhamnonate aldolase RhmA
MPQQEESSMAGAVAAENPVKTMMRAGRVALGMNVRLARSGDIARIAKSSGHDFIFIDGQHSLFNPETIGHIAQAALGCGIAPLVHVRSCDDPDASVLLDNGVTGIVFPDIDTADEARRAVRRARFPPLGRRSVVGGYAIIDCRPMSTDEVVPALQVNTLLVCMIETREGVENIEEIAAVDGVDVILVGANGLLTALGKPGQFGDPEVAAAIEKVIAAAVRHGKIAGAGGDRNLTRQMEYIRRGARFITTNSEIAFIMAEATRVTTELRRAL